MDTLFPSIPDLAFYAAANLRRRDGLTISILDDDQPIMGLTMIPVGTVWSYSGEDKDSLVRKPIASFSIIIEMSYPEGDTLHRLAYGESLPYTSSLPADHIDYVNAMLARLWKLL